MAIVAKDINQIILGAGEVYMYKVEGTVTEVPNDETIETEEHNVGHCSGGFSIEYKPTKYEVKNQYGRIVKSFITEEAVSCKTGILSWNLDNLALLSTGVVTSSSGKKTLTIGGGGALNTVLVRFVHTKDDGKKIRFTMFGQGGSGFALDFSTTELTVDAELTAVEKKAKFLCSIEEEVATE